MTKGKTIAVVSPSWGGPATYPWIFDHGLEVLRGLGYVIKEMSHVRKDDTYIRANPQKRAEDLNTAFADKDVDIVIAAIGGDDSVRVLPFLDEDIIRNNPKIFMGFSDTTALHVCLSQWGVLCLYGPSVMAGWSQYHALGDEFRAHIGSVFDRDYSDYVYQPYDHYTHGFPTRQDRANTGKIQPLISSSGWRWLQGSGVVQGQLWGGCLEVLRMVNGTSYRPDWSQGADDVIFFCELAGDYHPGVGDVVDFLRNLAAQGMFERVTGFLWSKMHGYTQEEMDELDEKILSFFVDELQRPDIVIVSQMDFGHTYPQHIMPYNASVSIDVDNHIITLL